MIELCKYYVLVHSKVSSSAIINTVVAVTGGVTFDYLSLQAKKSIKVGRIVPKEISVLLLIFDIRGDK